MDESRALIEEIERYCKSTGTAESTFGRLAVNDGKLVSRLRSNQGITLKTVNRVRDYMAQHRAALNGHNPATLNPARDEMSTSSDEASTPFRFYDNRQKYLAFVNTCNEKAAIARRAGRELQHIKPVPPAFRMFDAGMGDATVMSDLLRDIHRRFPTVPVLVVAKEISLEDVRLGLEKLPDRFFEHPGLVVVITNLFYSEAPRLMPRDVRAAAALNWREVRLEGSSSYEYREQLQALHPYLAEGWATRPSEKTGNPIYERPSVMVIYREDHEFMLNNVIPRPGRYEAAFDFIIASQPWRLRMGAEFKAQKVLAPLTEALAPGGRLLAIQSSGNDPALEIVQRIWPDENPFTVNRHELIAELKRAIGRGVRDFNFNAFSDAKSVFRYHMHTMPSEIGNNIGTSTLFAAWNAATYVNQIEDARIEEAAANSNYLKVTNEILQQYDGLWFNDETFVISRHRR